MYCKTREQMVSYLNELASQGHYDVIFGLDGIVAGSVPLSSNDNTKTAEYILSRAADSRPDNEFVVKVSPRCK